jgi:pimeloyl-ACP methyl ester carboxylesterase
MSIVSKFITANQIEQHYLTNNKSGTPIIFVHGNASDSVFWKSTMASLPDGFAAYAPDLRGYGQTADPPIDGTKGFGDYVADLEAFCDALGIEKAHFIGHSLGGGVLFSVGAALSHRILSLTLVNPASPFGFGGTKDLEGTPCFPDFAGSGGGIVNPEFANAIAAKDRTTDNPNASPLVVMRSFYWKPPFVPANEAELLEGLLRQKIGQTQYPGDFEPSENYPFVKPGKYGPINASSPKYIDATVQKFQDAGGAFPVLWIRGDADLIVSDQSFFDFGTLGQMGLIPNYPGVEVYPPQPMVSQTRYVLEQFAAKGGVFSEVVMSDCGHTPFIEAPEAFQSHFFGFITQNS